MDTSNISAKVFTNGKLHIAGCRTPETATKVVEQIRDFIAKYTPDAIKNKELYELSGFRIVMLKTSFKFNLTFDLETFSEIEYTNDEVGRWVTNYEPNKFTGLKIFRFIKKERATILIFRTGSATIAAKTVEQLVDAYNAITLLVRNNKEEIAMEHEPLQEQRRPIALEYLMRKMNI
jgi:TATA-box binding protein (TBP) (component of TFIID and TFIIIB)